MTTDGIYVRDSSLKYECVYLRDFQTGSQARRGIEAWMTYYNDERPHSALGERTPMEAYHGVLPAPGPALYSDLAQALPAA